jgi:Zn-dependent membrane protease YugP
MNQKLDALVRRVVFGPSREAATSDLEKYLFLRRYCVLLFVPLLIAFVLGLVFGAPMLLWIVLGLGAAAWLTTVVKLPFDLRRERRRAANRRDA